MMAPAPALTKEAQSVKKAIEQELFNNRSVKGWKGTGVAIGRNQFSPTTDQLEQVNVIGVAHGCHTCGTKLAVDRDQPWIGDHIPPTKLKDTARDFYETPSETYLFPQCDRCALRQSALVKELNKINPSDFEKLDDVDQALVRGGHAVPSKKKKKGKVKTYCIRATGPKVTQDQGQAIQHLGNIHGCHSCNIKLPRQIYHADHVFPQEFCTSYMEGIFQHLGIPYPAAFELRPQCPRCSGDQGGKMAALARRAQDFAKNTGLTIYK